MQLVNKEITAFLWKNNKECLTSKHFTKYISGNKIIMVWRMVNSINFSVKESNLDIHKAMIRLELSDVKGVITVINHKWKHD